jgi:hypothetical protein
VYFSHGKESGPWGRKIMPLAKVAHDLGFSIDSIDCSDILDPDLRDERLVNVLKAEDAEFLLAGSSMGGYVSLVASEHVLGAGVLPFAPALFLQVYKQQNYTAGIHLEIVLSRESIECDCTASLPVGDVIRRIPRRY